MDAFAWAEEAAKKLAGEFGTRLAFVGLQGSRARGEAHEGSDIDLVIVLDHVCADDLARCRAIIESLPHAELACGFIGSAQVLAAWPRHELFQFTHDTHAIRGRLDEVVDTRFTRDDARAAARIGASGIYHAACHAYTFEGEAADDALAALFKGAFFALQALQYARTGSYPKTKSELAQLLVGDEARILAVGRSWEHCRPAGDRERKALVDLLIRWSEGVIANA